MPAQSTGPEPRTEGATQGGSERLFRLERLLGLREPQEHGPIVWILLALMGVGALFLAVLSLFASPPSPGTPPYQIPFIGLFLVLLVQGAGDFFYRRDRRLSALLRVGTRLVGLPAVAAVYATAAYLADGAMEALFVGGVFFAVIALGLILERVSGPRRSRGPGPL